MSGVSNSDRAEYVFFDLETTILSRKGQREYLLEFGAIVTTFNLVEITEVDYLFIDYADFINTRSIKCNGITKGMCIAEGDALKTRLSHIYKLMHGRIWVGHNIRRFDIPTLNEAFRRMKQEPPEPSGVVDTLDLFRNVLKFRTDSGSLSMQSLATYFNLGTEEHRALADAQLTLDVLKRVSTMNVLGSLDSVKNATAGNKAKITFSSERKSSAGESDEKSSRTPIVESKKRTRTKAPVFDTVGWYDPNLDLIKTAPWREIIGDDPGREDVMYLVRYDGGKHPGTWRVLDFVGWRNKSIVLARRAAPNASNVQQYRIDRIRDMVCLPEGDWCFDVPCTILDITKLYYADSQHNLCLQEGGSLVSTPSGVVVRRKGGAYKGTVHPHQILCFSKPNCKVWCEAGRFPDYNYDKEIHNYDKDDVVKENMGVIGCSSRCMADRVWRLRYDGGRNPGAYRRLQMCSWVPNDKRPTTIPMVNARVVSEDGTVGPIGCYRLDRMNDLKPLH